MTNYARGEAHTVARPRQALLERAAAGRDAVRNHAGDPALTLASVVWPTKDVIEASSCLSTQEPPCGGSCDFK